MRDVEKKIKFIEIHNFSSRIRTARLMVEQAGESGWSRQNSRRSAGKQVDEQLMIMCSLKQNPARG